MTRLNRVDWTLLGLLGLSIMGSAGIAVVSVLAEDRAPPLAEAAAPVCMEITVRVDPGASATAIATVAARLEDFVALAIARCAGRET